MSDERITIKLNGKYSSLLSKFKQEIIEIEGGYYGYFGDYVAEAIEFYLMHIKHYPEKIGKERNSISNLSKSQQRTNKFIEFAGESLKPVRDIGLDYITFYKLLQVCFKKGYKTLKAYENEILTNAQWSIINIPKSQKRIVLHRNANIYGFVQRFDITLKNYYAGLRPTKEEDKIFAEIRNKLLPQKEDTQVQTIVHEEMDNIFNKSLEIAEAEEEEE